VVGGRNFKGYLGRKEEYYRGSLQSKVSYFLRGGGWGEENALMGQVSKFRAMKAWREQGKYSHTQ